MLASGKGNSKTKASNGSRGMAFYIESLLLVLFLLGCIIILVQIFASARVMGGDANRLTTAVTLARNAAESFIVSNDTQDFAKLLNVEDSMAEEPFTIWYDKDGKQTEQDKGDYRLVTDVSEQEDMRGLQITVQDGRGEMIYSLATKAVKR